MVHKGDTDFTGAQCQDGEVQKQRKEQESPQPPAVQGQQPVILHPGTLSAWPNRPLDLW